MRPTASVSAAPAAASTAGSHPATAFSAPPGSIPTVPSAIGPQPTVVPVDGYGRAASFEFRRGHVGEFHAFGPDALLTMFAPDVKTADAMSADGLGGTFCLDVSDVARGVDGNTLAIRNTLAQAPSIGAGNLLVENIEVGWFDRRTLPKPRAEVPARGPIAGGVAAGTLRLAQARGGGFAVRTAGGVELLVETALGMKADTPAGSWPRTPARGAGLRPRRWSKSGGRPVIVWLPSGRRRGSSAHSKSAADSSLGARWTNTGQKILGIPFRHRVFLRGEPARFWLAGSDENTFLASASQNPTVYAESSQHPASGAGITAESDWLRLLMWLRARSGVCEIYTQTLALAPGCSIDFELSIAPVRGGYWSFLNGLRQRRGLNGITMKYPVFFNFVRAKEGADEAERIRNSLGHLGPVMVALGPWVRGEPDCRVVTSGAYPKLAKDTPRRARRLPGFRRRDVSHPEAPRGLLAGLRPRAEGHPAGLPASENHRHDAPVHGSGLQAAPAAVADRGRSHPGRRRLGVRGRRLQPGVALRHGLERVGRALLRPAPRARATLANCSGASGGPWLRAPPTACTAMNSVGVTRAASTAATTTAAGTAAPRIWTRKGAWCG